MTVRILVRLKKGIADPQGAAVRNALHALGFERVEDVRVGRLIEVTLPGGDQAGTREACAPMCEKLLANPVIEEFEIVS